MELGHPPVIDVLSATHRIGEVNFPAVAIIDIGERRGDAALSHNRVGFAEQAFADHAYGNTRRRCFNRGAQSRAPGPDYENVVLKSFVVGHGRLSVKASHF